MKKVEYICQFKSKSGKKWCESLLFEPSLQDVRREKNWNIENNREARIIKRTTTEEVVE